VALIDALTAKARNYLKKTGDAMISGFLTLYQDPVQDMHAVTKRYVDNAIIAGAGFDYRSAPLVGKEYYPNWGYAGPSQFTTAATDIGLCFIAPFYFGTTLSFDRIRVRQNGASNSTHRIAIYKLSSTTWLPTELIQDCGTVSWAGVGGDRTIAITFTNPQSHIGIGWLYEGRTDSANPLIATKGLQQIDNWPVGHDPASATLTAPYPYRIQSTGNPPGAAPLPATFSLVSSSLVTGSQVQPLVGLRRV